MCDNEKIKEENKENMEKYSLLPLTNDEITVEDDSDDINDCCWIW